MRKNRVNFKLIFLEEITNTQISTNIQEVGILTEKVKNYINKQ